MATQKRSKKTWWSMCALALILVGLLILVHRLAPSPGWRTFLDIGVVVVSYGLMGGWLETHSEVLLHRPAVETDSAAAQLLQVEPVAPPSPHVHYQGYGGSAPATIYGGLEYPTVNQRSNGYHYWEQVGESRWRHSLN